MTKPKPKLTKAQETTLQELAVRSQSMSPTYPPIIKLLALGLISKRPTLYNTLYEPTELGRAAVTKAEG